MMMELQTICSRYILLLKIVQCQKRRPSENKIGDRIRAQWMMYQLEDIPHEDYMEPADIASFRQ